MNVVGHGHEGMHSVLPEDTGVIPDRLYNQVGKTGPTEIERARTGLMQQTIRRVANTCPEGSAPPGKTRRAGRLP